jgi:hypothetical protein
MTDRRGPLVLAANLVGAVALLALVVWLLVRGAQPTADAPSPANRIASPTAAFPR